MNSSSRQPVVVGFDGSAASCAAVDWAARAAQRHALPLEIVSVVDYPGAWTGFTVPDAPVPADLMGHAEHLVETAAHRAEKVLPGARVRASVVQGPPAAVLRTLSETASLLVLGNRRHHELGALSSRSVTFALAAHAQGALVLVPDALTPSTDEAPGAAGATGDVVVGVDDSQAAARAADRAAEEAAALGVGLTVVSAWSMPMESGMATFGWVGQDPGLTDVLRDAAKASAAAAAAHGQGPAPGPRGDGAGRRGAPGPGPRPLRSGRRPRRRRLAWSRRLRQPPAGLGQPRGRARVPGPGHDRAMTPGPGPQPRWSP